MTRRRHINGRERAEILSASEGCCHICGGRIAESDWEIEHVIPLAQGGDDYGDNLRAAHRKCHRVKTAKDAADTARAKRLEAKRLGTHARSRRGFRGWRDFKNNPVWKA